MCLDTLDYTNISITVFPERITFMMTVTTVEVADLDLDLTYEYECFQQSSGFSLFLLVGSLLRDLHITQIRSTKPH